MGATAADPGPVYEFLAGEYGWSPKEINEGLTDEQILDLLDNAADRLQDRFAAMVESVRVGTVIAHDRKAASKWRAHGDRKPGRKAALSAAQLEQAVMQIGELFPGHVIHQAAA